MGWGGVGRKDAEDDFDLIHLYSFFQIIKEDLWPNPLQYYLMGEGGENGEDNR